MLDSVFVDALRRATTEVLLTMANMQIEPGNPSIEKKARTSGDITGVIGLVSDRAKGSIAVTFSRPVVIEVIRHMTGIESEGVDDLALGTAGEMANMVAGLAERILRSEQDYNFTISLPTVISGNGHVVIHKYEGTTIVLPFSTTAGGFFVECCFTP